MLGFKRHDVLMHGRQGSEIEPFRDFFIAGAVPALLQKPGEKVEKLFLPFGECHNLIMGEEKENFKCKSWMGWFDDVGRAISRQPPSGRLIPANEQACSKQAAG